MMRWPGTNASNAHIAMKCTTRAAVSKAALAYDLDVKNYDDLRVRGPVVPRLLVVVVLPPDELDWLSFGGDGMTVRGRAYWKSLAGAAATAARRTVRVTMPRDQALTPAALRALMSRIRGRRHEHGGHPAVDRSARARQGAHCLMAADGAATRRIAVKSGARSA